MSTKKIFSVFAFTLFVLTTLSYAQEQNNKIILQVGRHSEFIRFVLIFQDENLLNSISANLTKERKIQVLVPSDKLVEFNRKLIKDRESGKDFTIERTENAIYIEIPNIKNIKSFKLSSPNRFVLDVYTSEDYQGELKTKREVFLVIDPGHGGKDKGIVEKNTSEKDITLSISKEIASKLAQRGVKVALTRAFDEDLTLKKRVKISSKANFLLSIHLSNNDVFRTYYRTVKSPDSKKESPQVEALINILKKKLERNFSLPIYTETLPIYLVNQAKSQAVLIELPNRAIFNDKKFNSKIADTIAESISEFYRTGAK